MMENDKMSKSEATSELIVIRDGYQKSLDRIESKEELDEYDVIVKERFEKKINALNVAILFLNCI